MGHPTGLLPTVSHYTYNPRDFKYFFCHAKESCHFYLYVVARPLVVHSTMRHELYLCGSNRRLKIAKIVVLCSLLTLTERMGLIWAVKFGHLLQFGQQKSVTSAPGHFFQETGVGQCRESSSPG